MSKKSSNFASLQGRIQKEPHKAAQKLQVV